MNGSLNPTLDKEEHVLKLGESFEKKPKSSFHTVRCESIDYNNTFHTAEADNTPKSCVLRK